MDLLEFQGKQFFATFDIPISAGRAVDTVESAVAAAEAVGYPVVVKAQVHVGGRGKAGGVKLAADEAELRTHAGNIIGMDIKGHKVRIVWIEHASDIAEEYYASFTLDRSAKQHLGMLSAQGGVEIETVAEEDPDAIAKVWVDPVDGLSEQACREWVKAAKLNPEAEDGAVDILLKLTRAYTEGDADLVEINPLILKPEGGVHALDAKVTLDNNAEFRHEWGDYELTQVRDERERPAYEKGLQYVGLDGYVGIIANGAGLAMSTLDVVNQVGGEAANFLDIGGGANADVMSGALEIINNDHGSRRSSSTSSAASPEAKRSPTASSRRSVGSRSRRPSSSASTAPTPTRVEPSSSPTFPTSCRWPPPCSRRPARSSSWLARARTEGSNVSIFVDENTKVVYQGLTGSQGRYYGLLNRDYGTNVVAGTNPKKAGTDVDGIPVFASVANAVAENGATASCIFIPARLASRPRRCRMPEVGSSSSGCDHRGGEAC